PVAVSDGVGFRRRGVTVANGRFTSGGFGRGEGSIGIPRAAVVWHATVDPRRRRATGLNVANSGTGREGRGVRRNTHSRNTDKRGNSRRYHDSFHRRLQIGSGDFDCFAQGVPLRGDVVSVVLTRQ